MKIKIPVKPHIKKFILKSFRSAEPLRIEEDSLLGKHCMSLLIDRRQGKAPNYNDLQTATLQLDLSAELSKRTPSVKKLERLNLYFEKLFKHSLYTWVHACAACQVNPYNATRTFVEYFDFDENQYTHDAAQRAWLRYKNNEYTRARKKSKGAGKSYPFGVADEAVSSPADGK
jgi:hypothetical protein